MINFLSITWKRVYDVLFWCFDHAAIFNLKKRMLHGPYKDIYHTIFYIPCRYFMGSNLWAEEFVHMRVEKNSYRIEISSLLENKFCSNDVSFRLHFKTTRVVLTWYFITQFISVKMIDMKSKPAMSFKCTCTLKAISNESVLIHFALGKFYSHKNLMPF